MPEYRYECPKCHHKFETIKAIKDRRTAICPNCGELAALILSTFNFNFKDGI